MNELSLIVATAFQAVVQGVTEFLPISSSGHLLVFWNLFGQPFTQQQTLAIDVALHLGSLGAVIAYFWSDVINLVRGGFDLILRKPSERSQETLKIIVATIPVVIVGLLAKDLVTNSLRVIVVIAIMSILFGILLWIADRRPQTHNKLSLKAAFCVGLMQVFALIPGTSRSASAMIGARFFAVSRIESARFAVLLGIPTILAAGVVAMFDLWQEPDFSVGRLAILAALLSFFVAYLAIAVLMRWVEGRNFTVFVIYRLIFGAVLLWFFT